MAVSHVLFVILFLLQVRLRGHNNFHTFIRRRYGKDLLSSCRSLERVSRRLRKAELDLHFLQYCNLNNIIPNFVKFKLYKASLYQTHFYDDATKKLLTMEINYKQKNVKKLTDNVNTLFGTVTEKLSFVDCFVFKHLFNKSINEYVLMVQRTHERKLDKLGISIPKFNDNKTVFNFSSYSLSKREEFLLSLGLDFGLPCYKPNYTNFYSSLEMLFSRLKNLNLNIDVTNLRNQLQVLAQTTYNSLTTHWTPFFSKKDLGILKKLAGNKNIHITRPDKGKGTVILNKTDYIEKVERILSDDNKFTPLGTPDFTTIFRIEDRINLFLRYLKENDVINNDIYRSLYSSGASYGILYGLPKIHKPGNPIRPILTSYETANYNLAKYLVPLLAPLTMNEYSLNNSKCFKETILCQDSDLFMVSLDVESLFTNVPVEETIQIILNKVFITPDTIFNGFNKSDFKRLLELAVLDTAFVFNGKAYKQIDGMAMGSPLGPTFANIFMCSLEEDMLDNCPLAFHPLFYRRYVDDTFLLFRSKMDADTFLEYVNSIHRNINFTIEYECSNQLPFLDILVYRDNDHFNTSVFRKKTFTGLGSNFYSHCFFNFKLNSLSTLIHRAYTLTSNWHSFHQEIIFLQSYFHNNCYPSKLFHQFTNKFLNKVFIPKLPIPTVPKLLLYASLPLIHNLNFYSEIRKIVEKHIPAVKLKLIPKNPLTIGSIFPLKERLDPLMTSGVVYEFNCPRCDLGRYIGSTRRLLKVRAAEHMGVSYRTGMKINNPEYSNIRNHTRKCKHKLDYKDFKIIGKASNDHLLAITESLLIKQTIPQLNVQTSATPLYLS